MSKKIAQKNKTLTQFLLIGVMVCAILFYSLFIFSSSYKNTSFYINELKYSNKEKIQADVYEFLSTKPYFRFRSHSLEQHIKKSNPLVNEVTVKKSIILKRSIITIEEYKPIAIIRGYNEDFFITADGDTIPYQYTGNSLPNIHLGDKKDDIKSKEIFAEYILKTLQISNWAKNDLNNKIDIIKIDSIGSLSLIFKNNKTFNFDLNELHFSIDDQIKVIQNVLTKVNYKVLDLRYSYLVVKS